MSAIRGARLGVQQAIQVDRDRQQRALGRGGFRDATGFLAGFVSGGARRLRVRVRDNVPTGGVIVYSTQ